MKSLSIDFNFNDKLGLTSIVVNHNETGLAFDAELIKKLGTLLIRSVEENADDLAVQDFLNETNTERESG